MKKTKFFIRAAVTAALCVLMFASCSGGSSGGGDDYSENQPGTGGGTETPGGSGSGTPGVPGGTEPDSPDNPNPGGPDVPSVSYESASAVLKAVLGESAYSSYAAETSSSVTLTQTALIEAADIFPTVQNVVPDASSFSAAQSKVNGAASESQKVLVAMAEGKISITKGAAENVILTYRKYDKESQTYSGGDVSVLGFTYTVSDPNASGTAAVFKEFDYHTGSSGNAYLAVDKNVNADWSAALVHVGDISGNTRDAISTDSFEKLFTDLGLSYDPPSEVIPSFDLGLYQDGGYVSAFLFYLYQYHSDMLL